MCLKLIITEEYEKGVLIVLHATWQLNLLLIWLESCCQIGKGVDLWLQAQEKVSCFAMSVYRWLAIWNAISNVPPP